MERNLVAKRIPVSYNGRNKHSWKLFYGVNSIVIFILFQVEEN